jgi:hypothetical protein
MSKTSMVLLVLLASLRTARAEELPSVAVTVSPVHLILPVAELTAELRLANRIGVAVILGAGSVRETLTDTRIRVYEGGASFRYYVTGSFRSGLQLGGEALYVFASTDETTTMTTVAAEGLGLSPFAGYKWTHRSGITLEGQVGATFIVIREKGGSMEEEKDIGPMLNLNFGYSF